MKRLDRPIPARHATSDSVFSLASSRSCVGLFALVLAASLLAGCASQPITAPAGERFVEMQRSPVVKVLIENTLSREILVQPNADAPGAVPLAIGPGRVGVVQFQVVKVTKLSEMSPGASGWLAPGPTAGLLLADAPPAAPYVEMDALLARVRVHAGDTTAWVYPLELGECVFCGQPSARITVERRPRATDEPARLCREGGY